jgi:hypothetical protein
MGTRGSFPGSKAAGARKLTTNLHLVLRSRMHGTIPPLLNMPSRHGVQLKKTNYLSGNRTKRFSTINTKSHQWTVLSQFHPPATLTIYLIYFCNIHLNITLPFNLDYSIKEYRLRVLEKRVLREYLDLRGRKWCKTLHNEEFHNLYPSPNIVMDIKSRWMGWTEHAAHMGKMRNTGCGRETGNCKKQQFIQTLCLQKYKNIILKYTTKLITFLTCLQGDLHPCTNTLLTLIVYFPSHIGPNNRLFLCCTLYIQNFGWKA